MRRLVALAALWACGAHAAARPAERIAETIERMEQAVLRADAGAYMLAVDPSDPVFDEEQRKWARDLRAHPVASVAFEADLTMAAAIDGGAWRVPLTVRWTLPDEDAARSVRLDAVFRPLGLGDGDWVFAGREWESHPADGVRLLFSPGDVDAAEMAVYLADHVGRFRDSVEAELGETLQVPPTIKIYPDMASLQASIALSYTDPLGGWNEPGESIKLLSRAGYAGPALDATVSHEMGHAVSFEWGEAIIRAPWWSLEGIAEVCADPFRGERYASVEDAAAGLARADRLIEFERLADFRGEAMNYGRQVYVQGRSMVHYIGRRFGREARNDWFRAMGTGTSLEKATSDVLGICFDRLEADWRASLTEASSDG